MARVTHWMTVLRSVLNCALVRRLKMLYLGVATTSNADAEWKFSSTESSLYRSASVDDVCMRKLLDTPG